RSAKTAGGGAARIGRALIWSASAHLLAVSSLFLLGAGSAAVPRQVIVDVFLVEAPGRSRAAANRSVPRPPAGESRRSAVSPREKEMPPVAPSSPPQRPETVEEEVMRPGKGDAAVGALVPGTPPDSGDGFELPAPGEEATGAVQAFHAPSPDSSDPGRTGGGFRAGAGTALLRERIQSRIIYPEEAVRRGEQGEVLLRIRIGMGGIPQEIRIARSSGAPRLDEAASRGVVRAAPLPSDPGWVEVPVRFRLR
ncbi:MAG: TonB family protein, partial [Candidatus Deferrimicrobiaceae bacterium]